jgi:hypothetical protein
MSQRPTLDASTFEGLLAAAWVLQGRREQEARNQRPASDEMLAEPPETHVQPYCVSERDTDEPHSRFAYQLDDDVSTFHWGRVLVLAALLGCLAAAVWHWRHDFRDSAARFSLRPAAPTVEGPQGDAQSTMDRNKQMPPSHKIQSPADGVWEKTATKPSAYIPFDSVTMALRHYASGISRARPIAAGTSMLGRNRDEHASSTVRASAVAPAGVSSVNPPQGSSLHNSESQTTRDAQSAMDRDKPKTTDHKIETLAVGGREDAATNSSAGKPAGSVSMTTRHYVPRPPQGFKTSNSAAEAGQPGARPPSPRGPLVNKSRSEPLQWAMSRYVPRPPWSSSSGRTSEPSVPRPPARKVPRAPSAY